MQIISSNYQILRLDKEQDIKMITTGYCVCYKTPIPDTYEKQCEFVKKHRHHESQLEHSIMSVLFDINVGVSHDLVRHRHTAYGQESTRWCNYSKDRFTNQLTFIENTHLLKNYPAYSAWVRNLENVEQTYLSLLDMGLAVDEVRGCLSKDLATRILVSTNFREWRSIFKLRCDKHAHYQMREVMRPLLDELKEELPCVFDDISY